MNSHLSFISDIKKKIVIRRHIKKNFPHELLLMRGRHISQSSAQSIVFFTVHRCASQFLIGILKRLVSDSKMTHINVSGYLWRGGKIFVEPGEVYKKNGYIYGPFYGMDNDEIYIPLPDLNDFKILLILRDPRDVLTSYYFHHAFDPYFNLTQQEFIKDRSEKALSKTIDEWVLEMLPVFKGRYIKYLETLENKPNVLLLRYEDMIMDFSNWLYSLIEFMDLKPREETLISVIKSANFSVKKEDVKAHKRQVASGDHARKLKENTIKILNSEFREILAILGYKQTAM